VRRGRTITVVGGGCERRSSSRTQRRSQSRGLLPPPSPSPSPLTAVRASKSIESAVVPALPATERTKRHGRARRVCCWRFVRLEADGGYEAEQDHTPRVYTHTHTHTRARARAWFLLSVAPPEPPEVPSRSFFSQLRALRSSRPFHLIPSFTRDSDCDSTWLRRSGLSFSLPIVPADFRDGPRSYLSRMFPATGTPGRSCSPGLSRRGEGEARR